VEKYKLFQIQYKVAESTVFNDKKILSNLKKTITFKNFGSPIFFYYFFNSKEFFDRSKTVDFATLYWDWNSFYFLYLMFVLSSSNYNWRFVDGLWVLRFVGLSEIIFWRFLELFQFKKDLFCSVIAVFRKNSNTNSRPASFPYMKSAWHNLVNG
jgi:hypothetical protein